MDALLEADEETDGSVYAAYLRAQCDADLLDILQHLDPERYPARVDAVRRETQRRRVLPVTVHSPEERFIRGLSVAAFFTATILILLTLLLTRHDARIARWPDLDRVPDGTPVSEIMLRMLLGVLRALVVGGVECGFMALLVLTLTGWLLGRVACRTIRTDAKGVAVSATVLLLASLLLAASPFSSIPSLPGLAAASAGFWGRLLTLVWPW